MEPSRIDALVHFYETLNPQRVQDLALYYREDAYFKDPFNEVNRLHDIRDIFVRMFEQLIDPRFVVSERIVSDNALVLVWELKFRLRVWKSRQDQVIRGVTHLRMGDDGKVIYHRDYWDTSEELYVKLPLIGAAVRLLRRAMG